jgi:hypothetical protein
MEVDGLIPYFLSIFRSLTDPSLRRAFLNRRMMKALRQFSPYMRYGLYTAQKAA